jgi:hypothetical protein
MTKGKRLDFYRAIEGMERGYKDAPYDFLETLAADIEEGIEDRAMLIMLAKLIRGERVTIKPAGKREEWETDRIIEALMAFEGATADKIADYLDATVGGEWTVDQVNKRRQRIRKGRGG